MGGFGRGEEGTFVPGAAGFAFEGLAFCAVAFREETAAVGAEEEAADGGHGLLLCSPVLGNGDMRGLRVVTEVLQ
jgi:hypothetical protein